jgi:glycosyltransferase involved in cell wall biosynthesis
LSPEPIDSAKEQFIENKVNIHSLNLSRLKGFIVGPSKLTQFIQTYRPDIIHTMGIRADMLVSKYIKVYQRLTTIHNNPYQDYPMKFGAFRGNFMAWKHIRSLYRIDTVVACSHSISRNLNQYGIDAIPIQNAIDDTLYTPPSQNEKLMLRQKLGLHPTKPIFVSVGSLIPRKDPLSVIRGFLASNVQTDSILVIVGNGPMRSQCEEIATSHSNIHFTGQVNNVVEYLQASDYFISASLSEGLPNTVLEALACGLPVCLSGIEPHQEILTLNTEAGILFHPKDIQAITKGIEALFHSDTEMMSRLGLQIIQNHFTAKRMAKEYYAVYEQILQTQKRISE